MSSIPESLTFAAEIAERTGGRGVDVVLNSLPGEALELGIAALAPWQVRGGGENRYPSE